MSSHFSGKSDIYQFHVKHNGTTIHGAAALNKILATEEGRNFLYDRARLKNLIMNFQTFYEQELDRLINISEETGKGFDEIVNFDNVGVDDERRDDIRGIILNHPWTELILQSIEDTNPKEYIDPFNTQLRHITEDFNFMLDGEIRNKHVVEVW